MVQRKSAEHTNMRYEIIRPLKASLRSRLLLLFDLQAVVVRVRPNQKTDKWKPEVMHSTVPHKGIFVLDAKPGWPGGGGWVRGVHITDQPLRPLGV